MSSSRSFSLALAAVMALGAGQAVSVPSAPGAPKAVLQQRSGGRVMSIRQLFGGAGAVLHKRRRGPGWTHAQVQRMARKRRNQQRHRAQCRRGSR